jgi:hypothetical protein
LGIDHLVRSFDGHWRYARYIDIAHQKLVPRTEGEIYDLVKMPFVPPAARNG